MATPISGEQQQRVLAPAIAASWARCKTNGVEPGRSALPPHLGTVELERRRAQSGRVIAAAQPHLEWLNGYFADIRHVVYLTDQDGVVLVSLGDAEYQTTFGLLPGHCWSEDMMGTNGAGTALASEAPIAVVGAEHYVAAFRDCTCVAAPVRDRAGLVIGAIDVSASPLDLSRDRVELMTYVARMVQRDLAHLQDQKSETRAVSTGLVDSFGTEDFVAIVAHELRNRLSGLLNAARLLERSDAAGGRWSIAVVERYGRSMSTIIADLLDIARIRQGKFTLKPKVLDLGEVIEAAIADVRPAFGERRQHLTFTSRADHAQVRGDRDRLEQIFINLLSNANKYGNEGGSVHVSVDLDGDYVLVSVRDSGIGILPEVLPHLFELYVQSPRALQRSQQGLGIGLALVKMLVVLHGGDVRADSDGPGRGATFTVRLRQWARSSPLDCRVSRTDVNAPRRPRSGLVRK